MKIISWNVNGLRSVWKKGFFEWLKRVDAEIVGLQEIKISSSTQLPFDFLAFSNYFSFLNPAKRKGYAGVAIFAKEKPLGVETKIGFKRFDDEGRFLKLSYPQFSLINLYLPHGGRQKENLAFKLKAYEFLFDYLLKKKNQKLILIGDFNIAHQEIDLARPKQNRNNIMFTPQERKLIDKLLKLGLIDSFRKFHQEGGYYTWWPYFSEARERNLGWRIDYIFVTKNLTKNLKDAFILSGAKGSDHCPVGIKISF